MSTKQDTLFCTTVLIVFVIQWTITVPLKISDLLEDYL